MPPLAVVPEEPCEELPVERLDIHPEVVAMIVGELFLYRTVESF